jgi:hypothetical protein
LPSDEGVAALGAVDPFSGQKEQLLWKVHPADTLMKTKKDSLRLARSLTELIHVLRWTTEPAIRFATMKVDVGSFPEGASLLPERS